MAKLIQELSLDYRHFFMIQLFTAAILFTLVHGRTQLPLGSRYFDVQGHRGGRGNVIENSLPSFAWAMIDGVTTLELDNGITRDGVVVVWHDEMILPSKCQDTAPVFEDDPAFPYVGKYIVNLTLAQVKTLDCGSKRQPSFPMQRIYPGTKISTLSEVFAFAGCADPNRKIRWNIESKINPVYPNITHDVQTFVKKQHAEFLSSSYPLSHILYQSFDWRTLVEMKALNPIIPTSALIEQKTTGAEGDTNFSPWLAGLRLDDFPGSTLGMKIASAAAAINADVLSPAAVVYEGNMWELSQQGYVPFTTGEMVQRAHHLGLDVIPWTVNNLGIADQLIGWGVDGIISDYPDQLRRWAEQQGLSVSSRLPKQKVLSCLNELM